MEPPNGMESVALAPSFAKVPGWSVFHQFAKWPSTCQVLFLLSEAFKREMHHILTKCSFPKRRGTNELLKGFFVCLPSPIAPAELVSVIQFRFYFLSQGTRGMGWLGIVVL